MTRSLTCAALVALALAPAALAQGNPSRCGVERWPVKVAIDADAGRIDGAVHRTTISELAVLPRPATLLQRGRAEPYELLTLRVVGIVLGTISEDDGDIHVIVGDIEDPTSTIVAEVPDSACALGSTRIRDFANAYRALRNVQRGDIVILDGVGFFDYVHGQTGVAPNGFELHPIVGARVVGTTIGRRRSDTTAAMVGKANAPSGSSIRVWVNTSSRVYHCPNSQWYGATRRGMYMTESEALASGYRPAYRARCSR